MAVCRSCTDDKPDEEFPLRDAKKGVRQRCCRACVRAYSRAWYEKKRDHHRENVRRWKAEHPEKVRSYKKTPQAREADRLWRRNNPDVRRANKARYRAMKLQKTPPLTKEEQQRIRDFYRRARELTQKTRIPHHVDHILPLAHPLGLHHPDNMQVIPAKMNLLKGAKLTLDTLAPSPVITINANEA